jgi:hypothetical protein
MPMPTGPTSALMVIQPQLLLQLPGSLLNPESFMKETNHIQSRHTLRHIAEEIPEFISPAIPSSSLYNQPDFQDKFVLIASL